MMNITVRLYATLRKFGPPDLKIGESFKREISQNFNIQDLLNQLGIEREQAKIIMINGVGITDVYYILKENDEVAIFPPVGGG